MATDSTKPQATQEEKKTVPQVIQDRNKTFSQILQEQQQAKNEPENPASETPADANNEEDNNKPSTEEQEAQAAKEKIEAEEAARKRDAELAAQSAAEVLRKQEEAKKAEQDRIKAEEAEKARQEALKPKFTGVDDKGNPIPKTYEELAEEAARIGKEKALEEFKAEQQAKEARAAEEQRIKAEKEAAEAKQREDFQAQLKRDLDNDEAAIFAAGGLPKMTGTDRNDMKDPGAKALKHLYETAQKVNADRMAKGQPLIRSLQLIRYGVDENGKPYYTPPTDEVPGHDAPVLGSEPVGQREDSPSTYNVARDRKMSITQIMQEEARKAASKFKIRGK
ncbi:MAG TPA: hypothetical protein VF941_02920 [Clostridia bacterium]